MAIVSKILQNKIIKIMFMFFSLKGIRGNKFIVFFEN